MKKKNLYYFFIFMVLSHYAGAQNKIERFCKITVYLKGVHKGDEVIADYGKKDNFSMLGDTTVVSSLEKVNDFKNSIDALDYMNSLGWKLVNIISFAEAHGYDEFLCFFKKEFEK